MSWQQFEVTVDAANLPRLEALLRLAGAVATSMARAEGCDVLEPAPGDTPLWPRVRLRALFPSHLDLDALGDALAEVLDGRSAPAIRPLPDAEWRHAWTQRPRTRRIGRRLLLAAEDEPTGEFDGVVVRLGMGLAFGTGEHPTTALCLEWLAAHPLAGARILDYGCGSGVLAIAALRLGASAAWAVDVEPQAWRATGDNAALNDVQSRLWIGSPDTLPAVQVDLLMANILTRTLIDLAPKLTEYVAPGGHVVLSGVLQNQSHWVRNAFAGHFGVFSARGRDGWVCLTARRR